MISNGGVSTTNIDPICQLLRAKRLQSGLSFTLA
jgi:hypothetical protein